MGARLCHRRHPHRAGRAGGQDGFTYVALLIVLAVIAIASAATLQMGALLQRRQAERELLSIGHEFSAALTSYAAATPVGQLTTPPTLEVLLKDPRYPNITRHLRKLYADPITGKAEWGLVKAPDGNGIVGIHSLSTTAPIKIGNFEPEFQALAGRTSYTDWIFRAAVPRSPPSGPVNGATPAVGAPPSLYPPTDVPPAPSPGIAVPPGTPNTG
ncbi:MAG: type secretion system pseudopilin PulG [Herbaspirillum sp.]|jgi:type II secretory pathway pseudopilin PulG|nr:type secretion system pseudopilin PulG [Herbaspirillum sp.]